jgi:acetyl-CoA carboxylase biotin carboxyl carrier protein
MPQDQAARARVSRGASARLDARVGRDHKAIATLADDLLPALIAKLAASGLGEIEIREGAWKARLRKPAGTGRSAVRGVVEPHAAAVRSAAVERGRAEEARAGRAEPEAEDVPIMATSPAVGVFQPRKGLEAGMQVRAGERLGTVDVLGVREDVVSPIDGIIGTSLAEAGEAVEYGQPLMRIEMPEKAGRAEVGSADREAAAVLGEA